MGGESKRSAGIGCDRRGAAGVVTLDRPQARNALTAGMRQAIAEFTPELARDPNIYGLVLKSAVKGTFSGGGDVRELVNAAREAPLKARSFLADEYRLIWLLECFSKPTVALMDGAVMGAGAGITINATHRVGGEAYRFAMPETMIGFFPDDGLAFRFARMPDHLGVYLGLTGRTIGRADALRLGLLTHCMPQARFAEVEALFADAEPVDPVLDDRHEDPGPGELERYRQAIAECFSAPSVPEIMARLEASRHEPDWCHGVVEELWCRSPTSLAVTLRQIREAAALDIRLTLMVDYRIACRLVTAPDFAEGVRALLVDKTNDPKWRPPRIAEVTPGMVDACFAPLNAQDLVLPTRQEMQAARV